MKTQFNNKIVIKSFSLLFIFCMVFMGCNDDDVHKIGQTSISFGEDSLSVSHDVRTAYLQLELTEPLEESCLIFLKSSVEESIRFEFPEAIRLEEGAIRGKYPILVYTSKFSFPDEHVTFTLDKVGDALVIDKANSEIEFTVKGKDTAGKVFIGFEAKTDSIGEDQAYFELPFKIQGVLEESVKLIVTVENGSAIEGSDFKMEKEIQLNRGETWNFIPFEIFDNQESLEDREFKVRLSQVITEDTLVVIYHDMSECTVKILNVKREIQVTDSVVEHDERMSELTYKFNLTAKVPETVTARVVVDDRSTAKEGVHFNLLQTEIEILSGKTEAEIELEIIDDELGNKDRKIFLKLENVVGGVEISKDYGIGKIIIKNDDNSVRFDKDLQIMIAETTLKIPVIIEGLLNEKLSIQLKVINGTAINGTDFLIQVRDIEKGQDTTYIEISTADLKVNKKEFQLELIGLQGESISINSIIDQDHKSCEINILGPISVIDRTDWTVVVHANSEKGSDCARIIDEDMGTGWHTHWNIAGDHSTGGARPAGPQTMVFDMGENVITRRVEMHTAAAYRTKQVDFSLGKTQDGPFELIKVFDNRAAVASNLNFDIPSLSVYRFIKLSVTGNPGENVAVLHDLKIFGNIMNE